MSAFEFPEPDTSMTFEYAYTDDDGIPQAHRMTLDGENAEHLPYIMKKFNGFLHELGFDVDLQVIGDATGRIGPAVKALLESDAKVCALAMLMTSFGAMAFEEPVGAITCEATTMSPRPTKPLCPKPTVGISGDPPPYFTAEIVVPGATVRFV